MTVASTPSSTAMAVAAANSPHKKNSSTAEQNTDEAATHPFMALLQGLNAPAQPAQAALDGAAQALQAMSERAAAQAATENTLDGLESVQLLDADVPAVFGTIDLTSLVGQTQHLDTQADRAVRDGLVAEQTAGGPLASSASWGQPSQGLLTASLGVQTAAVQGAQSGAQAVALAAQTEQLEQAVDTAGSAALTNDADTPVGGSAAQHDLGVGRIALQGIAPETATPAMQAVTGMVTQWVAQWLGADRSTAKQPQETASEGPAAANHLPTAGSARLTEQAVQAPQANQASQWGQAQEQARQEDLRFWLQGQQQRAEVLIQRDGQPVRVQVQLQGQQAQVVLRTNQEEMRALLDSGMEQLRDMLAQQGLQLADVHVQADAQRQENPSSAAQQPWGNARQATVQVPENVDSPISPRVNADIQGRLNVYA